MLARVLPFALTVLIVLTVAGQTSRPPIYLEDPKPRMARALELAEMDDIRVLIKWGANDCVACGRFEDAASSAEVRKAILATNEYHVVNVDVGKLNRNLDLAKQYGVTLKAELLPMLTVLDEHGKVLTQASAPDFLSPTKPDAFDPARIAAFFVLHKAVTPDAVAPFDAAVTRAKTEGKLVFVWFSAPW